MVDAVHTTARDGCFGERTRLHHAGFSEAGAGIDAGMDSGAGDWSRGDTGLTRSIGVAARFVVRLVACALQADEREMLSDRRGTAEIARARQIAMYLLHTSLSIAYADVATMFGRDRTTVSHACRTIEDLRDDPMHDDQIASLEEMVELARSMSAAERHSGAGRMRGAFAGS